MLKIIISNLLALIFLTQVSLVKASDNVYLDALPAWQMTLSEYVDKQGRTDFTKLASKQEDLAKFVDAIGQISPASHPDLFTTKAEILSYHINAYNALAMSGVIERGIPTDFNSLWKRASFFKFRKILIGGKKTNLYDYENKVIRKLEEPRIHFVLNCMVKDCPRLPQTVFKPETLESDLQEAAIEFFNKEKHIQINADKENVALSGIMKFYTKDYVASGKKQDLVAYVNQYRKEKIPENFKVTFIDYDWSINQQP